MKTIIPNELSFDLDLNDLPARADRVFSEKAINLFGGDRYFYDSYCVKRFRVYVTSCKGKCPPNYTNTATLPTKVNGEPRLYCTCTRRSCL